MNFIKYWENTGYFKLDKSNPDVVESSRDSWNACKEEILKIIFLNTKQNGKKTFDLEKAVAEIEKL